MSEAKPTPGDVPRADPVLRAGRALGLLLAALADAAAIVYLAWPLSRHPATLFVDLMATGQPLARWTQIDRDLASWVLGWTARASVTNPFAVFQANIFHPAPDALASSENLLGLLPVAAPVFLLSGNPVLTHNVTVFVLVWTLAILSFVATREWTGSGAAGFLAGAVVAFSPIVVASWSNVISGTAVHLFPLVLILAWRAARRPRAWLLVLLSCVVALQVLSGLYVAYQLLVVLGAFTPALWCEARRNGRNPGAVLLAAAAGFLVLVPLSAPYLRARASGVLPDFVTARAIAGALAPSWGAAWETLRFNLGWPVLALAVVGTVAPRCPLHLRLSLLLAALLSLLLSGGPNVPLLPGTALPGVYEIAMSVVPGFVSMRAPGRFLIVTVFALAMLAGLGAAGIGLALRARFGRGGGRIATALLLLGALLLVVVRGAGPGFVTMRVPRQPADWDVYAWLGEQGAGGALLELPAMVSPMDGRDLLATGGYLRAATIHGLPLLNGYSGHAPPSAALLLSLAQRLPDQDALRELCDLTDLTWIALHLDLVPADREVWQRAERTLPIERVAEFAGPVWLYRVLGPCGTLKDRLLGQLAGAGRDRSMRGTPLAPLDAASRRGHIVAEVRALPAGLHVWLTAEVGNDGEEIWPGATIDVPGAVQVQARFRDVATGELRASGVPTPLGVDLAPGESVRVRVGAQVPAKGEHVLELGLVQSGTGWFADQPGGGARLTLPVQIVPFGSAPPR